VKKWWIKAALQKTFSLLPGGFKLNYLFQYYVTKGIRLSPYYFETRLHIGIRHLKTAQSEWPDLSQKTSLELGTGWHPIVPIVMFLGGMGTIYTADLTDHKRHKNVLDTIDWFVKYRNEKRLGKLESLIVEERWEELMKLHVKRHSLTEMIEALKMESIVGDARKLPLADGSMDFIHSNNTFEHIYPDVLLGILQSFRRVIKPSGLMSHGIDMTDHFAHMDSTIGDFNFLKFNESQWKRIDNSIQPQNRLRISDYRKMISDSGFEIENEEATLGKEEELKSITLANPWRDYEWVELLTTHVEFKLRPKADSNRG
jgi:SAM-dependent methyltransferase